MADRLFRALRARGVAPSPRDLAIELATEMCERYLALRAAAVQAEAQAEAPRAWSAAAQECITTVEALLRGRHRAAVLPVVLRAWPELLRPPTRTEAETVDAYLAAQPKGEA